MTNPVTLPELALEQELAAYKRDMRRVAIASHRDRMDEVRSVQKVRQAMREELGLSSAAELSLDDAVRLIENKFPGKEWSVSNYTRQRGFEGCTAFLGSTEYGADPEAIATAETPALALIGLVTKPPTRRPSMTNPVTPAYAPWEYVVKTFDDADGDARLTFLLDAEGSQEWELVAFDFQRGRGIFKRPKYFSGEG